MCQKWDSNPRPHMWTRILLVFHRKNLILESGALDRSAILTFAKMIVIIFGNREKYTKQ